MKVWALAGLEHMPLSTPSTTNQNTSLDTIGHSHTSGTIDQLRTQFNTQERALADLHAALRAGRAAYNPRTANRAQAW